MREALKTREGRKLGPSPSAWDHEAQAASLPLQVWSAGILTQETAMAQWPG